MAIGIMRFLAIVSSRPTSGYSEARSSVCRRSSHHNSRAMALGTGQRASANAVVEETLRKEADSMPAE